MMNGPSDGGWWGVGMVLVALLFLALVVVGVVLAARPSSRDGHETRGSDDSRALDILEERYARGEIDQSEYEERRRALTGG
jgi:putative membrane protein